MNILLTSVGRRKYIVEYFQHALKSKGNVLGVNSVLTNSLLATDYFEISPQIYDKSYIPFLLDFCKRKHVGAIISLFDIDLPILAQANEQFKEIGVRIIGPNFETASIANDKLATKNFLKSAGLKYPNTYSSIEDTNKALNNGTIKFPLIIKPRFGMASIGVYSAEDKMELEVFYKKCLGEVLKSHLRYESEKDLKKSVLIQEQLFGKECGIDLYKDLNNNLVSIVAKEKIEMRSGETDIGEIISIDPFEKLCLKLGSNLKFSGILSLDCFLTEGGVFCIEINPRISGHYPFSHLAGVRYPEQLIRWLEGKETIKELLTAKVGIRGSKELMPQIIMN
jgi:carbamoyl-phosphate synthase large subunit